MKKYWPELLGSFIGFALMSPILYQVWTNAHWSVAFLLTGLWMEYWVEHIVQCLKGRRHETQRPSSNL